MELWDRVRKGCLLQAIPHGMVNSRTLLGGAVAGTLEEFPRGGLPGVIQGGRQRVLLGSKKQLER